jgi:hypothetical protein
VVGGVGGGGRHGRRYSLSSGGSHSTAARLDGPGFAHWRWQSLRSESCRSISTRGPSTIASLASKERGSAGRSKVAATVTGHRRRISPTPMLSSLHARTPDRYSNTHVAKPRSNPLQRTRPCPMRRPEAVGPAPATGHDTWPANPLHPHLPPPLLLPAASQREVSSSGREEAASACLSQDTRNRG